MNPINVKDPGVIRRKYGIPDHLDSCHTAVIDSYAIACLLLLIMAFLVLTIRRLDAARLRG